MLFQIRILCPCLCSFMRSSAGADHQERTAGVVVTVLVARKCTSGWSCTMSAQLWRSIVLVNAGRGQAFMLSDVLIPAKVMLFDQVFEG